MDAPVTRVASYARQSTTDQQTIATQLNLCRKLIDDRGWKETYRLSDNALKGRDPTRPAYQRLLELVQEQRIDVIVTWKFDRMFRSLKEASAAHEFAVEHNVSFVSVTEPFDTTTSIGRFLFGNLANFAQFETDLLKERANLGYERRVHEGKWTGAHPPYGYRKNPEGTLAICQDEATILKSMLRNYKRLKGDNQLAHWLNKKGLLRRGQPWRSSSVRRALTNPILHGELTQRGTTTTHPRLAIVTKTRYNQFQRQRSELNGLGTPQDHGARQASIDRVFEAYFSNLTDEPH